MSKTWDAAICNEKSGFLFSHECFRSPVGNCHVCQKPVCEDHSHASEGNVFCTACAKKDRRRHGLDESGRGESGRGESGRGESGRRYGRSPYFDDHDPYFYGGYYYGTTYYDSYHRSSRGDPHDFTEADAESLTGEMDEGFENDMSES